MLGHPTSYNGSTIGDMGILIQKVDEIYNDMDNITDKINTMSSKLENLSLNTDNGVADKITELTTKLTTLSTAHNTHDQNMNKAFMNYTTQLESLNQNELLDVFSFTSDKSYFIGSFEMYRKKIKFNLLGGNHGASGGRCKLHINGDFNKFLDLFNNSGVGDAGGNVGGGEGFYLELFKDINIHIEKFTFSISMENNETVIYLEWNSSIDNLLPSLIVPQSVTFYGMY